MLLTITTCKRYDLLEKTIKSFVKHCTDFKEISDVILYDDSSTDEDRRKIFDLLYSNFKYSKLTFRLFHQHSFLTDRRHLEIMKIWKEDISSYDYVFHLEDDWEFFKDFSLSNSVDILRNNTEIAYCGFNRGLIKDKDNNYSVESNNGFWTWVYDNTKDYSDLFIDEYSGNNIPNWPYFTFTPGVHDVTKLNTLSNFSNSKDFFERDFGKRYAKYFKSCFNIEQIVTHIGHLSAYELNNSNR